MRINRFVALAVAAVVVLGAGYGAWAKKKAGFISSEQCASCHKSSHPALITAYKKSAHHMALIDATKKPDAIVAKFDDKSPVKKSDIKWILGVGVRCQQYMDKNFKVLPGEWDVNAQSWKAASAEDGATQCVGCHVTNYDTETKTWTETGAGCESCHGPGSAHADSMEAADIQSVRKLEPQKQTMVCGQCHSVGTDTTGKYAFPTTYLPGNDLEKSFKLKDPGDHLRNSQYNDFITSKHYAGGMTCTTCHDPHGDKAKAPHQLKQPVNDQCLGCHAATIESLKKHAPDAPADATCATCHMVNGSHKFEKAKK